MNHGEEKSPGDNPTKITLPASSQCSKSSCSRNPAAKNSDVIKDFCTVKGLPPAPGKTFGCE